MSNHLYVMELLPFRRLQMRDGHELPYKPKIRLNLGQFEVSGSSLQLFRAVQKSLLTSSVILAPSHSPFKQTELVGRDFSEPFQLPWGAWQTAGGEVAPWRHFTPSFLLAGESCSQQKEGSEVPPAGPSLTCNPLIFLPFLLWNGTEQKQS